MLRLNLQSERNTMVRAETSLNLSKFFAFLISGWAPRKPGDRGYDTISLKAYSSPEPPVPLNRRGTSHEEIDLA